MINRIGQWIAVVMLAAIAVMATTDVGMALIQGSPSLDNDPLHQLPATSGKISFFRSTDVNGTCDKVAWGEPVGENCGNDDDTQYWYVAMRWPYNKDGKTVDSKDAYKWWHDKKILVTNPNNGKQVILAAKDWGPAEKTGRVINISYAALKMLDAETDNTVNVEFGIPTKGQITTTFLEGIDYERSGDYYNEYDVKKNIDYKFHSGVDIAGEGSLKDLADSKTEPVYAPGQGKVVYIGREIDVNGSYIWYGDYVVISNGYNIRGNGKYTYTFYSHMGNKDTKKSLITTNTIYDNRLIPASPDFCVEKDLTFPSLLQDQQVTLNGLRASYYNDAIYQSDINKIATPDFTAIDYNIDFNWHPGGNPLPSEITDDGEWSADWAGFLNAPVDGTYSFRLNSDDGSWLFIDGKLVVNNGGDHSPRDAVGSINLTKGYHSINVKYFECCGGKANINLYWTQPSKPEEIVPPSVLNISSPEGSPANMYISKNAPANMDNGTNMTYTLYYHNFGNEASNVVLNDTLLPNAMFINSFDGGKYDGKNVTWNIGSVAPFGRGSRTLIVKIPNSVPVGTVVQNTASISTTTPETTYADNIASAQTIVTGSSLPENVSIEPTNGNTGGTPSVYWGTPITFSYHSCPTATGVNISIHINDGGPDIIGSMTGGPSDWTYTTTFYPRHGQATIIYTVSGCDQTSVGFNIYIDPAGYIYDADTGARIANASVWLQRPDGSGGWENAPTGRTPSIMQPDMNPLITGADGQYQWDVLNGSYRVHVEASGYYPADSIIVSIPPPVTDLHVGLTRMPNITERKGDVNRNSKLDTGDATLILRNIVGLPIPSQYMPILPTGDMNCNGRIDTGDATLILRDVVGLPIPGCWE